MLFAPGARIASCGSNSQPGLQVGITEPSFHANWHFPSYQRESSEVAQSCPGKCRRSDFKYCKKPVGSCRLRAVAPCASLEFISHHIIPLLEGKWKFHGQEPHLIPTCMMVVRGPLCGRGLVNPLAASHYCLCCCRRFCLLLGAEGSRGAWGGGGAWGRTTLRMKLGVSPF